VRIKEGNKFEARRKLDSEVEGKNGKLKKKEKKKKKQGWE